MATSKWLHGVDGNFDTPSDWSAGVPMLPDGVAEITASGTYTVTSSQGDAVGALDLAKKATLDIADHSFVITGTSTSALAGTIDVTNLTNLALGFPSSDTAFNNTGTINLQSGSGPTDNAKLEIVGNVTLTGKGKVNMSGDDAEIVDGDGQATAGTLNNDSYIVGDGVVGDLTDARLTFNNDTKGVLNGNTSGGLLVATDGTTVTNSGVMEATTGSGLLILTGDINQMGKGSIKAATSGATVSLQSAIITGGQYSIVKGGILSADDGGNVIMNTTPIKNAGTIQVEGGNLVIGPVDNTGTGLLLVGGAQGAGAVGLNTSTVKGGKIEIAGGGYVNLVGPCSASVIVAAGATGSIGLFDPAGFTGTIAGLLQAPDASLDLVNIEYADDPTVEFNATKHLLTVTDPIKDITDTIKIAGPTGTFVKSKAPSGTTLISDPPAAGDTLTTRTQWFAQAVAAFGAQNGLAASGAGNAADHLGSSEFLAAPHHG